MKIFFVNLSGLTFNVTTPEQEPLGGTESSLCYLARELAKRGHHVTLAAKQKPGDAEYIMGVRHVNPALMLNGDFVRAEKFDTIIVLNGPVAGPPLRAMAPNAQLLLWSHLAPDHSAISQLQIAEARDSFDGIVYVSHWQRNVTQEMLKFTAPAAIIGNGFAPAFANLFTSADELLLAKENRAAYTTTPFRGLPFLIGAFAELGTRTKLDIYSSMKVYQTATKDEQYATIYDYAATNPDINNHGAVAQAELAQRLKPVAFFTYPSIYPETFCIAALEARAAGLKIITTATAALPEVLQHSADYVGASLENPPQLVSDFRAKLQENVQKFLSDPRAWSEECFADLQHVNRDYSWAERAKNWEQLLATKAFM